MVVAMMAVVRWVAVSVALSDSELSVVRVLLHTELHEVLRAFGPVGEAVRVVLTRLPPLVLHVVGCCSQDHSGAPHGSGLQ